MSENDGERPGRRRFIVYCLLFTMTLINYFDRTVLSIAMPALIRQFALTPSPSAICCPPSSGPTHPASFLPA